MTLLVLLAHLLTAQVLSPGELNRAHEKSEGLSHCSDCHKGQKQLGAAACFACHGALEQRVKAKRGLHGRMSDTELDKCQTCHHEHKGRDAPLIQWGAEGQRNFDHASVGWPLKGKHASAKCESCHVARFRVDTDEKLPPKTYLGLGTHCTDCHADEHRGQLNQNCASCHSESSWKPAPGFDHAKTAFALTGAHRRAQCTGCHERKPSEAALRFDPVRADVLALKPVAHEACTSCHDDAHKGQLGQRCESCHSTASWHAIQTTGRERAFHDRTRYPLKGAHAGVACKSCHGPFGKRPAVFKGLPFDKCMACHNDAHKGQLVAPSCERCHDVNGFVPARFEPADHTSFPLQGAHRATACQGCHPALTDKASDKKAKKADKKGPSERPLRFASINLHPKADARHCEGCHRDVHAQQFEAACESCHRVDSFHAVTFDHASTGFALQGAHANATCEACHGKDHKGIVRYADTDKACESCHRDAHGGQFSACLVDGEAREQKHCVSCHDTAHWVPTHFDHTTAHFVPTDKHASLPCARCHQTITVGDDEIVRYRPLPTTCERCHRDPHSGAFKGFEP